MRLVPADSLDLDTLVELFNEAYSDYVVPLRLDRAALDFTLDVIDADLAGSRIALEDGEPVSFAYLARRGDEGWIGGMGTAPSYRRRGIGEATLSAVLQEARALDLAGVRLEVIDSNAPARRLYEKLGFRVLRDVVVWMLEAPANAAGEARALEPAVAAAWIAAHRPSPEPWQRADESLAHIRERGGEFGALTIERGGERQGAVLFQVNTSLPRVAQIVAADDDVATELLSSVAERGGFRFLNAPADEPACRACERLGATVEVRQHEMELRL